MKVDITIKTSSGWINIHNDYDENGLDVASIMDVVEENAKAENVGTITLMLSDLELHVVDAMQTLINNKLDIAKHNLSDELMEAEHEANFG